MLFLQIGFKLNLEMVLNVIQLQFQQMCLSPDALAAHIRFKGVFYVAHSVAHDDSINSRVTEVYQSDCAEFMLPLAERFIVDIKISTSRLGKSKSCCRTTWFT